MSPSVRARVVCPARASRCPSSVSRGLAFVITTSKVSCGRSRGDRLLGRCLQHEIDHLNGKTLFESCDPVTRIEALRAYEEARAAGARPGDTSVEVGVDMRVVFMGTPALAASVLDELGHHHEVVGVYTRPDAVRGRGKSLSLPGEGAGPRSGLRCTSRARCATMRFNAR